MAFYSSVQTIEEQAVSSEKVGSFYDYISSSSIKLREAKR